MGEPASNPTDFLGKMKMMVGSGVENELVKTYLSQLHWYGVHLIGTQVQVGGSDPVRWDGNLDALAAKRSESGDETFVIECKTKSGKGADDLAKNLNPQVSYVAQLGLYLRDLSSKGVTNEGCLLYFLLSSFRHGEILQFNYRYNPENGIVTCYEAVSSTGFHQELSQTFDTSIPLKRWQKLEEHIAKKEIPKGEFLYKYPLTEELVLAQSDDTRRKMITGNKVIGDWEYIYSPYFFTNLNADGLTLGYTPEEKQFITRIHLKIHPKSRIGTKKAG